MGNNQLFKTLNVHGSNDMMMLMATSTDNTRQEISSILQENVTGKSILWRIVSVRNMEIHTC
jgi:hypothetical protein